MKVLTSLIILATKTVRVYAEILNLMFNPGDNLMSEQVRKILANKQDTQRYREAINELKKSDKESVKVVLSDESTITLVQ